MDPVWWVLYTRRYGNNVNYNLWEPTPKYATIHSKNGKVDNFTRFPDRDNYPSYMPSPTNCVTHTSFFFMAGSPSGRVTSDVITGMSVAQFNGVGRIARLLSIAMPVQVPFE